MTSAISSHGTFLKMGNGATPTEVFTTIAEVKDISGPAVAMGTEDVTNHDSGGWREFTSTIKEGGEITFEVNFFEDTTQGFTGGVYDALIDGEPVNFELELKSGSTGEFAAIVTGFELENPVEGVETSSITLQTTGAISWS